MDRLPRVRGTLLLLCFSHVLPHTGLALDTASAETVPSAWSTSTASLRGSLPHLILVSAKYP